MPIIECIRKRSTMSWDTCLRYISSPIKFHCSSGQCWVAEVHRRSAPPMVLRRLRQRVPEPIRLCPPENQLSGLRVMWLTWRTGASSDDLPPRLLSTCSASGLGMALALFDHRILRGHQVTLWADSKRIGLPSARIGAGAPFADKAVCKWSGLQQARPMHWSFGRRCRSQVLKVL
jgi:hypothetical protein